MHFLLFLILLRSWSPWALAQNRAKPDRIDENFIVFKKAEKCFGTEFGDDTICEFTIKFPDKIELAPKIKCVRNETLGESPILKIKGDYNIFRIQCSAPHPIDFQYYGVLPNEGIFVNWWKEVDLDSPTPENNLNRFVVEAEVYSVQALFEFYNNPENSLFENKYDGIPYTVKHNYPRTGNFTFPGIFDSSKDVGFYFVLEDGSSPEFLRNKRTVAQLINGDLNIPCISSHWDGEVELSSGPITAQYSYNPVRGLTVPVQNGKSFDGDYICVLKYQGETVDTLVIRYISGQVSYLYGFLDVSAHKSQIRIELERANHGDYTTINPKCTPEWIGKEVSNNQIIVSVPMHNFGFMRLRQMFALPEYYNRSYTARTATHLDVLTRGMIISPSTTLRMLTIYCRYGSSIQISDFGTSVTVSAGVPFGYGQDWAQFDRRESNISTHFILGFLQRDQIVYSNTEVEFSCKVNIPVVVRPVMWYTLRRDGSMIREFVDYNLTEDVSILKLKILPDMVNVICFGSYWYSPWFRNISMTLTQRDGIPPEIITTKIDYTFAKTAGIGSIKCEATGTPEPSISFKKDGVLLGHSPGNDYALVLDNIDYSTAGKYVCIASSALGTIEKEFTVRIDDGSAGLHIGIVITIPVLVFILTILGAYVYIKYFRPEKTGLTRQEIEEFVNGLKEGEFAGKKGEYAHDFAHLVPYTGEYEISPSHFKIDLTKVLGSGAYGMVLHGMLDDRDVAVKTIKRNADKQYLKALLSELKIMIYLGNHPNLIQIMGAYTKELSNGIVYVFVKYIPNGSLEGYLRSNKHLLLLPTQYMNTAGNCLDPNSFDADDLLRWAIQVASGMEYLSAKKVIHGDLATRNILLDEEKNIRITDFGLSRQLYDYSNYVKRNQEPLPWRWMAIESLKYLSFSTASDVWAYGITMWEIFSLAELPYPGYSWNLQFVEELENGLRMSRPKYASNMVYVLMSECWHLVPEKRPSFEALRIRLTDIMEQENEQ